MISKRQIERLVRAEAWPVLAERVLSNGRCMSERGRDRLCRPPGAAAAGLGLALQRLAELTYGPDPLGDVLARALVIRQRDDGLFGVGPLPSVPASAAALKGLLLWADRRAEHGQVCEETSHKAIHRGLTELCAYVGKVGDDLIDDVDLAVVLWQLADRPAFRRAVHLDGLIDRLCRTDQSRSFPNDELTRCARAMAA